MYYQKNNPHGGADPKRVTLDFSASVNPLGTPESVREAARSALEWADCYPDPGCLDLARGIAEAEGLPETAVLCGNGASELIYAYCAAVKPGRAMELAPTFSEYAAALAVQGCCPRRFELRKEKNFLPDAAFLKELRAYRPDVLFLCNPNNPTGRLIPPALAEEILSLCRENGIRLFLDESFLELSDWELTEERERREEERKKREQGESLKTRLMKFPGLFLLRSFTKSHAMAGLRLGYGLSMDAALLERMSALTPPWTVSIVAQAAGIAALQEREFPRKARELIRVERLWLREALERLGFWVCPSEANFLLFQGPPDLGARLARRGIAVRECGNFPGLGRGWYRIAVRNHRENERLIAAAAAIITKGEALEWPSS